MPVSLHRLRIAGFKSFAEPVVVEVRPGLTGIVGPNGCGKSNVVEALRWAMGESSARSLRGAEMDDVIFAGTAHRPRRDLAEVTLWLADTLGLAPPPFQNEPELEISRRIERSAGSVFRVNGREARARDVQTLFADLATGARSSAMVSQGRVAAVVSASPAERRTILEEAAGITGLHARRHEAELKLRAAEANLARAEDRRGQLDTQLQGLARQAKQAARFRTLGETIVAAEAELLAVQHESARRAMEKASADLTAAEGRVTEAASAVTTATTGAAHATAALPAVREAEAASRTALERARLEAAQAAAEADSATRNREAARQRAAQVSRDLAHAQSVERDAAAAMARLAQEADRLAAEESQAPDLRAAAAAAVDEAAKTLAAAEAGADAAAERSADLAARHRAAAEAHQGATARLRQTEARARQLAAEVTAAEAQCVPADRLAAAETASRLAAEAARTAATALDAAEAAKQTAQTDLAASRTASSAAEATRARLAAAAQGVSEALAASTPAGGKRVVDLLQVPPGLEAALAAGLGEDLDSATDATQPRHWRELPELPPADMPGVVLAGLIGAPAGLQRALSQISLVETDGAALQAELRPGQSLVSREGAAWRWDGHTVRPGTPRAAAVRLQQRNKLAALRTELAEAQAAASAAAGRRQAAEAAERSAIAAEQAARTARREADQAAERRRADHAALTSRHTQAAARLATLRDQAAAAEADRQEADRRLTEHAARLAELGDPAAARQDLDTARAALTAARSRHATLSAQLQALQRAESARAQRRVSLQREREDWALRVQDAASRLIDLTARQAEAAAAAAALEQAPERAVARRTETLGALATAEAAQRGAAAALQAAETRAREADVALRTAEARLARAREDALRAEAGVGTAQQAVAAVAARVQERLGGADLPALSGTPPQDAEDRARRRLERLQREQAEMGPVNLLAEAEADEVSTQIATILRETDELTTAIAKLRGSIGHINREGRERLGQVFADIDRHFRALFEKMFGGGKAHLAMVGSDDPLLAGLEIFAQPPGKKLASLSLLSGGEQALAAMSLIFAVFRCQPAPVCVLDEVDAPLDDANVGRFCALLEEMVRDTGTRFLVVTHHQLTMARMDRLYGVTMQERGVSRLLSVDLERAAQMIDPPRIAAE